MRIVDLSSDRDRAATLKNTKQVAEIDKNLDTTAAELWAISYKELAQIQKILAAN
jgi:hypothetical protein